jgi:hypothetical protein
LFPIFSIISAHPFAEALPITILGSSGYNEHPDVKVNAGLMMLNAGKIAPTKSTPSLQDDNDCYICSKYIM